ncbi:MAG: helix-turn-helix transcriptional regulator, partial [Solirubrobacteraceae bacterium]
ERQELLTGAAGLAAELFDASGANRASERDSHALRLIHALFWLTANLCEVGGPEQDLRLAPLALLIDDAHLLDLNSARFLLYLAERIGELPAVLAVALRPRYPDSAPELSALESEALLLHLAPLSATAVRALLESELGATTVADRFLEAAVQTTGGNPFLVHELATALGAAGVEPIAEEAARVRALAPESLTRSIMRRISRLPPTARRVASALVVLGDGAELGVVAPLANAELSDAADAADALAAEGILERCQPLRFTHPLVRHAIASDLESGWRATAELQAAKLLADRGASDERVAAHLLGAVAAGEHWIVDVLERAAAIARRRGAPEIAASYLRRAVAEPPPARERSRLLAALAEAEALAGLPDAIGHLEQAVALSEPGPPRAMLLGALGRLLATAGRHREATAAFERGVAEAGNPRGSLARELKAALAVAGASGPGSARVLASFVEELRTVPDGSELPVEREVLALAAAHAAIAGQPAADFRPLIRRALQEWTLAEQASRDGGIGLTPAAVALLYADELELSLQLLEAAMRRARADGAVLAVATISYLRAWPLYFTGALSDAVADAAHALAVRSHGWGLHAGAACAVLAHGHIERGDLQAARAALVLGGTPGVGEEAWAEVALMVARARLQLAVHDPAGALRDLRDCAQQLERQGVSSRPIPWRVVAVEAALALGDRRLAQSFAQDERERCEGIGVARLVGMALRVCGLAEGGKRGVTRLEAAVQALEASPSRLEHARALVDLGALLRRTGWRTPAREPLRRGLEMAQQFGAAPLARQAREELRAAGAKPRRTALSGVGALTPSEHRVAVLAAGGLTNREIAQELFITTKSVEFHLRHVFQKLDVASRTQLGSLLAAAGD